MLAAAPSVGRRGAVVLAGLVALCVWQLASLAWTASVPLSALEPQHTLALAAAAAAAALWLGRGDLPALSAGVLAAMTIVCVWNLVARTGAGSDTGDDAAPVGYANALAILAVVGILLAAGWAVERRGAVRLAALACAVPCAWVLWLSESRGAQAALLAGAAVGLAAAAPSARVAVLSAVAAGLAAEIGLALAASPERRAYWDVAGAGWLERPLLGSGAGTWARSWLEERQSAFPAKDAHSLFLQALAELGLPGLVVLALVLVLPLLAARRYRSAVAQAALGSYAAFVVHQAVDFDWKLTAVSLTGLALGLGLLADGERRPVRPAGVVSLAGVVGAAAAALLAGNVLTDRAERALRSGDPATGLLDARRAARVAPWAAEPWRLRGEAERGLGRPADAARSFRRGIDRDAGDVELWRALARVSSGQVRARALRRAAELDPVSAGRRHG